MLDYIIVGFGLAGMSFAEQLRKQNKSFIIIDKGYETSSIVAGGMYNPVILKRFTLSWKAKEQLDYAIPFYKEVELLLGNRFLKPFSVRRLFNSIDDQNNWIVASDKPNLSEFMNPCFIDNKNEYIDAHHKYGEVLYAGRLLVANLLKDYQQYLTGSDQYLLEDFNFNELSHFEDHISYKSLKAKSIIFAEGFGLKNNPYFNRLPLVGNKGETLVIHSPNLKLNHIVKSGVFLIPLGDDNYFVGATYNRNDKDWKTTEVGKEELLLKLSSIIKCNYQVVSQDAGIRPTVGDRRPLLGRHPKYSNYYVLNGMGTRGVMVAPLMSKHLYEFIENDSLLDEEININRFKKWNRS
ncbi:NAD(P)/FAD-dependent oxidoreductase [Pseudofulvibacter geojedonensis]|uniref:NAD(P)/FAD-dependent oxidoreductase n=1 Tax=Pseudofulvibacter geojedonensis TaxID=1123758 RepID=A0ABW3I4I3_9FLAO